MGLRMGMGISLGREIRRNRKLQPSRVYNAHSYAYCAHIPGSDRSSAVHLVRIQSGLLSSVFTCVYGAARDYPPRA